jgi:hypothetical protein
MQIQDDSAYVLDENPAALLDGAEIEATAHYRCLKIVRLWKQSSSLPRSRRDEMVEEEQRLANLYAATLFEIGCAFGIETADELKVRIEAACILPLGNARPQNKDSSSLSPAIRQRRPARRLQESERPPWKPSAKSIRPGLLGEPSTTSRTIT